MDVLIHAVHSQAVEGGVEVALNIATNSGHQVGTAARVDFAAAAAVRNTSLRQAGLAALSSAFGLTVGAGDRVVVMGGFV